MARRNSLKIFIILLIAATLVPPETDAGVIKDLFAKITNTNNKTQDTSRVSVPICGSSAFSTPDEKSLSPEIIFITNKPSRSQFVNSDDNSGRDESRRGDSINEVANEFKFHVENVTLDELEKHGFNRDAPITFLMHGFTSGYPLQAWMSAIVESYTIDRESSASSSSSSSGGFDSGRNYRETNEERHQGNNHNHGRRPVTSPNSSRDRNRDRDQNQYVGSSGNLGGDFQRVNHNLFIINWNYAARGILYPRAVANIPIVASYVTRFINEKLLEEARIDPEHIQLIGHSLGAHLAGFVGKSTRSKMGRIYGLDPAGPCFGSIIGPLYPSNKRLAPGDAEETITIHTNSALLGINRPLGKYSVFVEGGAAQPGCKGGGVLDSLNTLTWDDGSFDTVACSHSRAPNLLTYRHDQSDPEDNCQLIAYECKDWDSYLAGHCGNCLNSETSNESNVGPLKPVECLLIGLDWQYPKKAESSLNNNGQSTNFQKPSGNNGSNRRTSTTRRPSSSSYYNEGGLDSAETYENVPNNGQYDKENQNSQNNNYNRGTSSTRRPSYSGNGNGVFRDEESEYSSTTRRKSSATRGPVSSYRNSSYSNSEDSSSETYENIPNSGSNVQHDRENQDLGNTHRRLSSSTRRPSYSSTNSDDGNSNPQRERRETKDSATMTNNNATISERSGSNGDSIKPISMFLRTGDTQPYCVYQYQVVLELHEPFQGKKQPPMSILLQDTEPEHDEGGDRRLLITVRKDQNSLSNDEFGKKFNDKFYTHLLTSSKKLRKIDHGTLLFREKLPDGQRFLKALHINYMSHIDPKVRKNLSSRLCLVKTDTDNENSMPDTRFYFEPCESGKTTGSTSASSSGNSRPSSATSQQQQQQITSRRPSIATSPGHRPSLNNEQNLDNQSSRRPTSSSNQSSRRPSSGSSNRRTSTTTTTTTTETPASYED